MASSDDEASQPPFCGTLVQWPCLAVKRPVQSRLLLMLVKDPPAKEETLWLPQDESSDEDVKVSEFTGSEY
eukprot:scaffold53166_cov34-Prasinocladus_malaysianus.AAC.1